MPQHVAIVGGGFSGAMLAAQLARAGAGRITLIERGEEAGRGLAYGPADPIHLLNVRAGNMSAWPDEPDHFATWLGQQGVIDAAACFAPRRLFGRYVREQLAGAGGVDVVHADAMDLDLGPDGVRILLSDGRTVEADAAVLAIGNLPPPPPPGIVAASLPAGTYWGDPWAGGVAEGLDGEDKVLLIGTGLTMVDVALLLDERGFEGPILALSRRGLTPRAHAAEPPLGEKRQRSPGSAGSALVRDVRARADAIGWRHAVDELRPFTQQMWRAASPDEKRRFLRHLRPWWDVHRHRIAPEVHARLSRMMAQGQLRVAAGKLIGAEAADGVVTVRWRPRGAGAPQESAVTRIVNCTGPEGDLPRTREPLLQRLLTKGAIRPGPIGLGIDVDEQMRAIGAAGLATPRLLAVGPMTRGAFWEIVAVPDIRVQVRDVARTLSATGS